MTVHCKPFFFSCSGKVDIESLLSFAEPEIFIKSPIHNHISNWIGDGDYLTVKLIVEMLKETASHVLAIRTCADGIKLTDFGATSFDILRFSDRFEFHLKTYLEGKKSQGVVACNVSDVINSVFVDILDKLMSSTLLDVAIHILSKLHLVLEKEEGVFKQHLSDSDLHTIGFVSKEPVSTSCKGQKHMNFNTSPVGIKKPKLENIYSQDVKLLCQTSDCLDPSESYVGEVTENISSLKGGNKYKNGR